MGKIKIHKAKINKFIEGDVLSMNYYDDGKWIFIYREDSSSNKIGCHCSYCVGDHDYFDDAISCDFNLRNDMAFNAALVKNISYATHEDFMILQNRIKRRIDENKSNTKYCKSLQKYIDMMQ